jgi:hypothetical protein
MSNYQIGAPFYSVKIKVADVVEDKERTKVDNLFQDISHHVVSLSFSDSDEKAPMMNIILDNRNIDLLDNPAISNGNPIAVTFGYPGWFFKPQMFVVDEVRGFTDLELICLPKVLATGNKAKNRIHKGLTKAEVTLAILKEVTGVSSEVDTFGLGLRDLSGSVEIRKRTVANFIRKNKLTFGGEEGFIFKEKALEDLRKGDFQQGRQSNLQFLYRLAEKNNYQLYIQNGILTFAPRKFDSKPIWSFTYYNNRKDATKEILDFNIDSFRVIDHVAVIEVKSWDSIKKKARTGTGSDSSTKRDTLGSKTVASIKGNLKSGQTMAAKKVLTSPEPNEKSVQNEAETHFKQSESNQLKATMTVIGNPDMLSGNIIDIQGISKRMSGSWYIKEANHSLAEGSGYVTTLKLIRGGVDGGAFPNKDKNASVNKKKPTRTRTVIKGNVDNSRLEFREGG